MQSGRAGTAHWVLEFEPSGPRVADPLMGWIGSGDTSSQVRLTFATQQEAVAYAEKRGVEYDLELPQTRHVRPKAVAEQSPLRPAGELDLAPEPRPRLTTERTDRASRDDRVPIHAHRIQPAMRRPGLTPRLDPNEAWRVPQGMAERDRHDGRPRRP